LNAFDQMNHYGKERIPFLFMVDFELKHPFVFPMQNIDATNLLYDVEGLKNYSVVKTVDPNYIFKLKEAVSFEKYSMVFDYCIQQLMHGNSYLLNLTFPSEIETDLSLKEIFYISRSKYKLWYRDIFVCFTPETFLKIIDGKIFSFPMKGTIDASLSDAKEIILTDDKEVAEHYTIVDLIRNDLNMVAKNVKVDQFRYIDKITTNNKELLQVSSKISGVLPSDYHSKIGEIIYTLLPAGSVSGAPKKKTLEIIRQAEQYKRGYYTGIFGTFDGTNLNSAVMIRYIESINGKLYYKSGGGITTRSKAVNEYNELLNKIYLSV
jgi:para-aminobenzoate synthetase component I